MNKIDWLLACVGIVTASLGAMVAATPDEVYTYVEPTTEVVAEVEELSTYICNEDPVIVIPTFEITQETYPEHDPEMTWIFVEEETEAEVETETEVVTESETEAAPLYFVEYSGASLTEASVRSIATYAGNMYGIDPDILLALSWVESRWTPTAVSPHNAVGLCQIIAKWQGDRMARLGLYDLYDPVSNMIIAADLIHELQGYPNGADIQWVLMAYNEGVSSANQKYNAGIISDYVRDIFARREELR